MDWNTAKCWDSNPCSYSCSIPNSTNAATSTGMFNILPLRTKVGRGIGAEPDQMAIKFIWFHLCQPNILNRWMSHSNVHIFVGSISSITLIFFPALVVSLCHHARGKTCCSHFHVHHGCQEITKNATYLRPHGNAEITALAEYSPHHCFNCNATCAKKTIVSPRHV